MRDCKLDNGLFLFLSAMALTRLILPFHGKVKLIVTVYEGGDCPLETGHAQVRCVKKFAAAAAFKGIVVVRRHVSLFTNLLRWTWTSLLFFRLADRAGRVFWAVCLRILAVVLCSIAIQRGDGLQVRSRLFSLKMHTHAHTHTRTFNMFELFLVDNK